MIDITRDDWHLVEALFHAAIELPEEDRPAFIGRMCRGRPELQCIVLRLLVESECAGGFLESEAQALSIAPSICPYPTLDYIARYRLIRLISQTDNSLLFEAEQDTPRRRVALKIPRSDAEWTGPQQRHRRESEIHTLLKHPNIVTAYEQGVFKYHEEEIPFLSMELIQDAKPVTEYCAVHSLDVKGRLRLFLQACEAVQYAHQKGLVHGDLKPHNILVDSAGHVKVIDFGSARFSRLFVGTGASHTRQRTMLGTIPYASPEQMFADLSELDNRADVYSLGVVLYQLLCDELPHRVSRLSLFESVRTILEQGAPRPSAIKPAILRGLDVACVKALERCRGLRYQSVSALARELRRFLD